MMFHESSWHPLAQSIDPKSNNHTLTPKILDIKMIDNIESIQQIATIWYV